MTDGVIFKALSGFYYVQTARGELIECRARGRFRVKGGAPLVGDRVELRRTENGKGYITGIRPRENAFARPPVANIDKMVIVASQAIPTTDTFLIDKMTVIALRSGCEPVICINKSDMDPAQRLFEIYSKAGFKTIRTSARSGDGIHELQAAIRGSVCAFTGNSGVGKSSILNLIDPDFRIQVGDVSKKLGRGRHTTRHVELYRLPCGAAVADTPGFSAFEMPNLPDKAELARFFPDFAPYLGGCRFPDCAHVKEPDCAVTEAVRAGELQGSRYNSYGRLYKLAMEEKEWERRDEER